MARSSIRSQLFLNDGLGNKLAIQTGTWTSASIDMGERRRLSVTCGIDSATGAAGDRGGFTGTLVVQGTDELGQCNGGTGTQEAGSSSVPGTNGWSGASYWSTIPSGARAVVVSDRVIALSFSDVGFGYVRVGFNQATGQVATGALGGSGTWNVFVTAKNT